jgi:hypothetical protein
MEKMKNSARDVSGESHGKRSFRIYIGNCRGVDVCKIYLNPLNAELNPISYLLALLRAHHFFHVSRIRVKEAEYEVITRFTWFERGRSVHLLWTW